MCGIVAYIGYRQAYPIVIKGLQRLEYRGYDSAGVALLNGELSVYKKAGKVADLANYVSDKNLVGQVGNIHVGQHMANPTTEMRIRIIPNRKI